VNSQNTVIGYAPKYYYQKSSFGEARKNAKENFSKFSFCIVEGKQTYIQTPSGWSVAEDSLFINIQDTSFFTTKFENIYTFVDTFISDNLVLLGYSKTQFSEMDKQLVEFPQSCGWTTKLPEDKGFAYTVGMCNGFFSEYKSWQSAENNAILNLACSISLKENAEALMSQGRMMSKVMENVSVVLQNIQVVERWKDEKNNLYYVLVRM
jgi:hypothetical protein